MSKPFDLVLASVLTYSFEFYSKLGSLLIIPWNNLSRNYICITQSILLLILTIGLEKLQMQIERDVIKVYERIRNC